MKKDYFAEMEQQLSRPSLKALAYSKATGGASKAWDNKKGKTCKAHMPRGKVYQRLSWSLPVTHILKEAKSLVEQLQLDKS